MPESTCGRSTSNRRTSSAIDRVRQLPSVGERDEKTGLSESQIRALPVPVKIKLTRGAGRTLRNILIKDTNQSVALSVVNNAAMSDDEIAMVASSRSVIDEVLTVIYRRREWVAKYKICLALAKNPRIPVGVAVKLLPKLGSPRPAHVVQGSQRFRRCAVGRRAVV